MEFLQPLPMEEGSKTLKLDGEHTVCFSSCKAGEVYACLFYDEIESLHKQTKRETDPESVLILTNLPDLISIMIDEHRSGEDGPVDDKEGVLEQWAIMLDAAVKTIRSALNESGARTKESRSCAS